MASANSVSRAQRRLLQHLVALLIPILVCCDVERAPIDCAGLYRSQYRQDEWLVKHMFSHTRRGTYIDLAAFHPERLSNTHVLDACLKWKGVCIEGDPAKHAAFEASNRTCELARECVAEVDGRKVEFFHTNRVATLGLRRTSTRHK